VSYRKQTDGFGKLR